MSPIFTALQNVFGDPRVVIVVFLSAFFGVFVGSIPGLTATMAVALLVPITYWLDPITALAAVVSMVACAIFAGDIPNTLLRIPGTPASAAYANDASNLTRQGKSDLVLGTALVCSVVGGILGAIVLMLLGHQLAKVATAFSAVEYFWLYLLGLSCAVVVSSGPKLNGLLALTIGLLISTVGLSAVHSKARFTFGVAELYGGISFIPAMIGLFGVSEVLNNLIREDRGQKTDDRDQMSDSPRPKSDFWLLSGTRMLFQRKRHVVRSAGIGSLIGMLPGAGADIAAWVSFAVSKRFSKKPQLYGQESIEGIADATTANNAALAGAWIPALILGIPGDSVTAIVIGVLLMKNITPGPDIFTKQTELVYSIYIIFILANIILLPVGFAAIKAASHLVRIPRAILLPAILLFCIVGSYSLNASYLDVTVMLTMGVLGFVLERHRIPLAPIVLGLILGPMVEERFIQVMTGSDGFFAGFLNPQRPLALGLAVVFALVWLSTIVMGIRRKRKCKD
ncbi:MAG: C4-dicarboxylate ABC transporter permease [Planctomycetes bacterium B3_Pla]|nr:MAG: C4-dicarboxylate ABC transporter permease [Planctomycetes bacterium B3_Pla]